MKRWDYLLRLIPQQTPVIADVGSDHGYLAINAIRNHKVKKIYATDIAPGPLNLARKNIKRAGLSRSSQIKLIMSNGLDFLESIPEAVVDYVVIAGLGTKTIHEIVQNPNFRVKNYLILSNTEISKLRRWAQLNNFRIEKEDFFYDRQRPYWLILINAKSKFEPLKNFNFGDWDRWYKNNSDYQNYLSLLQNRHLGYNKKIKDPEALLRNKKYIQEIASYLKQWN